MSCVEITPPMMFVLEACRSYPLSPEVFDQLREMPEWETAVKWGWVNERTGELSGMGRTHAGPLPKGIVHG